jgi:cyclohexanone monooxygenase
VFGTGFDAMTGSVAKIDIRGRAGDAEPEMGGRTSDISWSDERGLSNMFIITGPGSPSVLSNMIVSIEQHVDWISDCVSYMRERNLVVVEATKSAEEHWVTQVNEVASSTLSSQLLVHGR